MLRRRVQLSGAAGTPTPRIVQLVISGGIASRHAAAAPLRQAPRDRLPGGRLRCLPHRCAPDPALRLTRGFLLKSRPGVAAASFAALYYTRPVPLCDMAPPHSHRTPTPGCRAYNKRCGLCPAHQMAREVALGGVLHRFCHKCSRLEQLSCFQVRVVRAPNASWMTASWRAGCPSPRGRTRSAG